jgi:hypothetical protein
MKITQAGFQDGFVVAKNDVGDADKNEASA